ncbi:retrotransposon gag protein [Striga asiatica]|uniref:Retrotransposon gag protein n=1 Tax=Striga asiatica TaxID=4170 RepID=A0A5A7P7Z2_STRAF|nr:retrotransposon gag protein [Striga asiatica]
MASLPGKFLCLSGARDLFVVCVYVYQEQTHYYSERQFHSRNLECNKARMTPLAIFFMIYSTSDWTSDLIHPLPAFHGLPNEDQLYFIQEFYNVLQTFPLQGLNEYQLKMRCIPETLKDRAKFIGRYYSHQKTQELRSQLVSFAQQSNEPLHEAWERFMDIQRDIGARTTNEMMKIFETMSTNSSQKSIRGKRTMMNEISQMRQLNARGVQPMQTLAVDACWACGVQGHSNMRTLGYQNRPDNDPFSSTYNPGWRNHPNFSRSNNTNQMRSSYSQQQQKQQQQRGQMGGIQTPGLGPSSSNQDDKLDKSLRFMANGEQLDLNNEASIKRLEMQLGQLTTRIGNMEAESDKGKLYSQPEQAKAITVLKSGKSKKAEKNIKESTQADSGKPTDNSMLHMSPNLYKPHVPFQTDFETKSKRMREPLLKRKAWRMHKNTSVYISSAVLRLKKM